MSGTEPSPDRADHRADHPNGTPTGVVANEALAALIARMREAEIPPSVGEMADALWLARWLPAPGPDRADASPEPKEERDRAVRRDDAGARDHRFPPPLTAPGDERAQAGQARLFERGPGPGTAAELRRVQVPAAPALPEPLALQRGLRILQRYRAPVRPAKSRTLDENRTADRAAESGLVHPVLRRDRRREARLLLVMDVSTSTVVWQQALDELRQVCERAGAFREVQVQYLHPSDASEDALPGYAASPRRVGRLHAPEQLSDPTGRRLTLVLSDCAGPMWRSGRIQRLLHRWGATAPVAVVQPLPQRMWLRTHLPAHRGLLHRREGPAGRLVFAPQRGRAERDALPVPVLALRRSSVEGWARLVAGPTGQSLEAAAGWVRARHAPAPPMRRPEERSGEDRVRAFVRQASPEARRLACYLSAVPLFLPVMQLVQHAMLAGTGPDVLSEVLLGGLLKRREDAADPRAVRYDFLPGVAAELRKRLTADEAKLLLRHCSEYIEQRFGRTAHNFPALAAAFLRGSVDPSTPAAPADPLAPAPAHPATAPGGPGNRPPSHPESHADRAGHADHAGLRAFAEVSSDVLRDLGRRTPWPLPRPPDPRLGAAELLTRGRAALGRYETQGLIRDLDDAIALFHQAGSAARQAAERALAAEELARALLARWHVRRVGDDLREALALVSAEHVTSPRGGLLRGTIHWLLAGELRSSWLGVDDLPDAVRRRARERTAAYGGSADEWAYLELLQRADEDLTGVVFGDAPPAPYEVRQRPPGRTAPGGHQGTGRRSGRRQVPGAPEFPEPPAGRSVSGIPEALRPRVTMRPPRTAGASPPRPDDAEQAEHADRRRSAVETLPAVRRALAEARPTGVTTPPGAAGPEDWYLAHLLRAATAATVRLEYPAPERGHLMRGRILLDLARQYLGRGPVERTARPDEARAAEAGRIAGGDLTAALGTPGALPAAERCRAWLDVASAAEIFQPPGDERGGDGRPRITDAVAQALAAAGDDDEMRLECHVRTARLYRDRHESAGQRGDLDRAVAAWDQAAALLAPDDPRRPGILTDYGATLVRRGEYRGAGQETGPGTASDDVDAAVRLLRAAVEQTPEDHPQLADRRRTLGIAHFLRFRAGEVLADLYEADWMLGEAARTAEDPRLAQDCWLQRGAVVMELADRVGNPSLLQRADDHLRHAVAHAERTADATLIARARQLHGFLLERLGTPDRALRQYREALNRYAESPTAAYEPRLAAELREAVARLESATEPT